MSILVRRVNRAKWQQIINEDDSTDSSADAITNCLKTTNNDLSVWKIENIQELEDAILALITGSKQTKLSTIHYVLLEESILLENGLEITESEGDTVINTLRKRHRDISKLTYKKLGIIKDLILEDVRKNQESFYTKAKLKAILKDAIECGKLQKEMVNKELIENEKL